MISHNLSDVYCKICDKRLTVGDSLLLHIFENHSRQFVNILIELNHQIIVMADKYFEYRPDDWKTNIENNKKRID